MANKKISQLNGFVGPVSGLTFAVVENNITKKGDYNQIFSAGTADNYVNISGDTMTGPLITPSISATTLYGDGSNLTGLPITYWDSGSTGNHSIKTISDSGNTLDATGNYAVATGYKTTASGDYSHAGGSDSKAIGVASFIHSTNSTVNGDRSVVIGGQNITGTTDDTVFVPNLNIQTVTSASTANTVTAIGVDENGKVVQATAGGGYRVYTALLTQTGTSVPTAVVLENTLGLTLTWERDSAGDYYSTNEYLYEDEKVVSLIGNSGAGGNPARIIGAYYDGGYFYLQTFNASGVSTDALLNNTTFEIRVYN